MPSLIPSDVYQSATVLMCTIAAFLNLIGVPVAIHRSKYTLGSFKIIMIAFSTTNMLHFAVDTVTLVRFYTNDDTVFVYASGLVTKLGATPATVATVWLCTIFMLQVLLEALHFMYRYVLLCRETWCYLLSSRNIILYLLVLIPLYATIHALNFTQLLSVTDEIVTSAEENTTVRLNVSSHNMHGLGMLYKDPASQEIRLRDCFGVAILISCNMILLSVMVVCGFMTHKQIVGAGAAKEMHSTLLRMLIAQTVLPLIFLHTPCTLLLIGPIFYSQPWYPEVLILRDADILMFAILIYPILEPLIAIYFLGRNVCCRTVLKPQITPSHNLSRG